MIKFKTFKDLLILIYESEYSDLDWIDDKFSRNQEITIKGTFHLSKSFLLPEEHIETIDEFYKKYYFLIGQLDGDYFKLFKKVFYFNNEFFICKSIKLSERFFVAKRNISILSKIDRLVNEEIHLGDNINDNLPLSVYQRMIKTFPNTHEIKLYSEARVSSIIKDYIDSTRQVETQYNAYLNKKEVVNLKDLRKTFLPYEIDKNQTILNHLEAMLNNEDEYSEKKWQDEIIKILLLLFPKYISIFSEVKFRDIYSGKNRFLDYLLVDTMGFVDVVEIKKPFRKSIVSDTKYRDNHIPNRELSGTIMQIEKYIYFLSKWGTDGEKQLTKNYKIELPIDFELKITNPKGIIIMGRDNEMTAEQNHDFEIIKRKYKNVIDIFTYDDLIRRLKVTINKMKDI